jgi:biopolymer transport protein TolR
MGMGGGGARGSVKSEINVTPLVDVVLVLLIIFMVVTPMLQKGRPVMLPKTDRPVKKAESKNELVISIEVDKNVFIESKWMPEKEFMSQMKELAERNSNKDIIIKADQRLTYGDVKRVLRWMKDAGLEKVALISERTQQQGK